MLDVLKPRSPSLLEFARSLAGLGPGYRVLADVKAVDARTETVVIEIEAEDIDFEAASDAIASLGGSVQSVDRVTVHGG